MQLFPEARPPPALVSPCRPHSTLCKHLSQEMGRSSSSECQGLGSCLPWAHPPTGLVRVPVPVPTLRGFEPHRPRVLTQNHSLAPFREGSSQWRRWGHQDDEGGPHCSWKPSSKDSGLLGPRLLRSPEEQSPGGSLARSRLTGCWWLRAHPTGLQPAALTLRDRSVLCYL